MPDLPNPALLKLALEVAVPLWIEELRSWSWDDRVMLARVCAQVVAEKGDVLQYGGEGCAEAFNRLAQGVAALAFVPGGVTIFGMHFSSKRPVP